MAFIREEWDVWHLKSDDKRVGSPFELVPPWNQTQLICMMTARSDVMAYRELYERTDYAEVWRLLSLQKAAEWSPPRVQEEKDKPRYGRW